MNLDMNWYKIICVLMKILSVQQCHIKHQHVCCCNLEEYLAVYEQSHIHVGVSSQWTQIHSEQETFTQAQQMYCFPEYGLYTFRNIFLQYTFRKLCTKLIYALKLEK